MIRNQHAGRRMSGGFSLKRFGRGDHFNFFGQGGQGDLYACGKFLHILAMHQAVIAETGDVTGLSHHVHLAVLRDRCKNTVKFFKRA